MAPCLPGLRLKLLDIKAAKLLLRNKDREGIGVSLVVHTECKCALARHRGGTEGKSTLVRGPLTVHMVG